MAGTRRQRRDEAASERLLNVLGGGGLIKAALFVFPPLKPQINEQNYQLRGQFQRAPLSPPTPVFVLVPGFGAAALHKKSVLACLSREYTNTPGFNPISHESGR